MRSRCCAVSRSGCAISRSCRQVGAGKPWQVKDADGRSTAGGSSEPSRRFGPDFVLEHRRRFGERRPDAGQLTYDIAVEDEHAAWRQWLDDQLAQLPPKHADAMARKIWLDEHFWTVNFELAVGAGLRDAGLDVAYEQRRDSVTPDWTVLSQEGRPLAFVEVHTDDPPQRTFAQMRSWQGLVERIKAIPVPVVLQLASKSPVLRLMLTLRRRSPMTWRGARRATRGQLCSSVTATRSWSWETRDAEISR